MNVRRRLVVGLGIGITAAVLSGVVGAFMVMRAHERGWAGISVAPPLPKHVRVGAGKSSFGPYVPQAVAFAFPGSPADRAGIRLDDKVVAVDGIDLLDVARLEALDERVKRDDVVAFAVERKGKPLVFRVRYESPFTLFLNVAQIVITTVVGLVFLLIGGFVFSRKPDDRRVVAFYILTLFTGVSMLGLTNAAMASNSFRGIVWDQTYALIPLAILSIVGMACIPLTLHLALIFPKDRPVVRATPHIARWLYALPISAFVAAGIVVALREIGRITRSWSNPLPLQIVEIALGVLVLAAAAVVILRIVRTRTTSRIGALAARPLTVITASLLLMTGVAIVCFALNWRIAGLIVMCAGIVILAFAVVVMPVLSCIALYRSYREANVEERRQVTWPLWGLIIALGGRVVVMIVSAVVSTYIAATHGDITPIFAASQYLDLFSRALLVLIPLSFAFAILKYRLMNIDVIIRKTVVYAILSGAIIVVYVVLVGGFGSLLLQLTGTTNQTVVIASTLFVALVFVPLRNKLQTLVDRNLFRYKYEYPDALRAIAAEALIASELAPFLASAAEKIQQALQNRSVIVFAQRHDEHIATAKVGVSDALLGTLRVHDRSIREALDRPFDPRRRALPDDAAKVMETVEAALVVPINTPGTPPNGFITLGSKLSGAELDVEDISFLRSVADQLDIGIDRIRQQRDEVDVAQARAIQQTLLPREMPRVAGLDVSGIWQPARDVGGDYYDLIALDDSQLAVCIGDVAGKGMPAALLMSGLQASVRVSVFESRSPRELCERVRRVVVSSLSGGRFVTFFFAIVDTAAMRLRWCNAGHNASILARADGTIVRLAEGGPAISRLCRDQPYRESELELRPGDRLLLFTDGASEACDAGGEMFGETRLEELVASSPAASARELQDTIVDAVTRFSRAEMEDDLTLVVVKL